VIKVQALDNFTTLHNKRGYVNVATYSYSCDCI
jgi:hypothetical protein